MKLLIVILLIKTEYNLVSLKQVRHNADKHSCLLRLFQLPNTFFTSVANIIFCIGFCICKSFINTVDKKELYSYEKYHSNRLCVGFHHKES